MFIFSFSVFLKPLSAEFGWSRTALSGGFALAALTVAAASPAIGRLVDRYGSKATILPCAVVFSMGFASLGWLGGSLAQFYAVLFLIGLVGNGTTQLAFSRVVVQAFDKRRGIALAVMMGGSGVGSMVMPWLAQTWIDRWGWRPAFQAFGTMIFLLAVPLTVWLIPGSPAKPDRRTRKGMPAGLRSPLFWRFVASFFLMSLAVNASLAHLSPLLTDRGFTAQTAALAASTLGAATLAGRALTGWLLDRWPAAWVSSILFAAGATGLICLSVKSNVELAFVSVALIGLGMGAEADIIPYLISRHFSMESFAELYGFSFSAFALAGALGPLIMGRAYDIAGSYDPVIALFGAAGLAAAILINRTPVAVRQECRTS